MAHGIPSLGVSGPLDGRSRVCRMRQSVRTRLLRDGTSVGRLGRPSHVATVPYAAQSWVDCPPVRHFDIATTVSRTDNQ